MDIFLSLARKLVEEEGNTRKEHHDTMHDCIEEEKSELCIEALHGVRNKVCRLNISDNGVVTIKDKGRYRTCYSTAYESTDTDNEGEGSIKSLARLKLDSFKNVCLEHRGKKVRCTELKTDKEEEYDKHDL